MKIIIPMASNDKDMLDNYSVIKPLVKLGKKTIAYIDLFVFVF